MHLQVRWTCTSLSQGLTPFNQSIMFDKFRCLSLLDDAQGEPVNTHSCLWQGAFVRFGQDVDGVVWFELMRKKAHLFYMRMDFTDAWTISSCFAQYAPVGMDEGESLCFG